MPALDAVLFLNPRNSVIDVVQSVGRVMRRAEGKRYGYIILPIGIPADKTPEEALKNNEKYKVVWQVLQALRAHDDRFNATINQTRAEQKSPRQHPGHRRQRRRRATTDGKSDRRQQAEGARGSGRLCLPQPRRMERRHLRQDGPEGRRPRVLGNLGARHRRHRRNAHHAHQGAPRRSEIQTIQSVRRVPRRACSNNLNPAVSKDDAIEMLAQHLITRPVFDALFANYAFTQHNPVCQSMQKMLDILHEQALEKETATLEKFYASVRDRAKGLDNAEARQHVVIELYDEFFRTAFPRMAERLGIVYTPVEVVDFIIQQRRRRPARRVRERTWRKRTSTSSTPSPAPARSSCACCNAASSPRRSCCTSTSTSCTPTKSSCSPTTSPPSTSKKPSMACASKDKGKDEYLPFDGICLTDTFQLYESKQSMIEGTFPENNDRVKRQKASPIRVVIANPPYSVGQGDANNNNQNLKYPALDERIATTYAARSTATLKNSLYDSYVRAIRWASDRINGNGVIGFVTNGYFIDGNAMDGLRACLTDEFQSIHVFNLRGNQRTSGEVSKQEGGKIFGSGSRNSVAITLLVKNPANAGAARSATTTLAII